jgi:hypothetical protein
MLPVVSDSFEFAAQNPTTLEKGKRAAVWAEILFGIVPEERLPDAFKLAVRLHSSTFPINGYEIKLAWEQIEREEQNAAIEREKQRIKNQSPVDICSNRAQHINRDGEVKICNPLNFNEEIILPCPACRPKAYDDQRARFIARNRVSEVEIKPLEILEQFTSEKLPKKNEEVALPIEEINQLRDEHNRLVRELVADPEAIRNLEVVFDAGANCFKLPHRADLTFSPEILKKKISSYQRILAHK